MSAQGDGTPGKRQRRAPTACDFCRHRKMKCTIEKPECRNCREHGKDCTYAELAKKPRPSNVRIAQLEKENRQLQETLSNLRKQIETAESLNGVASSTGLLESSFRVVSTPLSNTDSGLCRRPSVRLERPHSPPLKPLSSDATIIQRTFSPDKESRYHGPTSAVFDEKSTETGISHTNASAAKVPDVWVNRQLVAESARQRQLETVNFLAGKLDFDGVDPELGMHLLSVYWNRQHSSVPFVYRTSFMRDMACAGPCFSKLLLHAMYFYACKFTSRIEVRRDLNNSLTAGWTYRQRATELLSKSFDKSNITTIQALLIMSSVLFSWCDEKNTSWLYAGMAFSMIIDLGIHVDAATLRRQFSEEEFEIRCRVFWAAYVVDKLQALYQGRPAYLRECVTNLPMTFLDEHEELELFHPLSYADNASSLMTPVYSMSTFTESCKLSVILDKILLSFYTEQRRSRVPEDLLQESNSLHAELEDWRKSLPRHLDLKTSGPVTNVPLPNTLALLAMFNVLVILLHRIFVSDGHLHSTSSSVALDAFSMCSAAAFEIDHILQAYERSFCLKSTPYIISYATYVSATIHVRLAAQRERGSDAHKALRRCLDVLEIHQSVCWSAKRANRVINRLIARMGVVVDNGDSQSESYDLVESNLDIDAIIQTFPRVQELTEAPIQHLPPNFDTSGVESDVSGIMQLPNIAPNDNNFNENTIPLIGDDLGLSYDPIFGFGGSAFDGLDFGFGGDLL